MDQAQVVAAAAASPQPRPAIHCIAMGDPGSGKSTFARTWPKPLLLINFDGQGKELPYIKATQEVRNGADPTTGTRWREFEAADGLIRIEYYNEIDPTVSAAWERFRHRLAYRAFLDEGFQTVVVDSVTFAEICARSLACALNPQYLKDTRKAFGASTDMLEETLVVRMIDLPINVVLCVHIALDKDEVSGNFVRTVAAPGRLSNRNELCAGYTELYRCHTITQPDGTRHYVMQTALDNMFHAATQIGAPNPCWQHYESIWENWK